MKPAHFAFALLMLSAASFLLAQKVEPTTLSFEAVPPNTSPQEGVAFTNTGATELTLTIYTSGPPFAISENRCGKGVKPNSHCNVYLTYTPQTVGEIDNGTLTLDYGEGVATVPLVGEGVSGIPTNAEMTLAKRQCSIIKAGNSFRMVAKVWVQDTYYALPTGEEVSASCTDGSDNIDLGTATLTLCKHCPGGPRDEAPFTATPDQPGNWTCTVVYPGDGILAPGTGSIKFEVVEKGAHCQ